MKNTIFLIYYVEKLKATINKLIDQILGFFYNNNLDIVIIMMSLTANVFITRYFSKIANDLNYFILNKKIFTITNQFFPAGIFLLLKILPPFQQQQIIFPDKNSHDTTVMKF